MKKHTVYISAFLPDAINYKVNYGLEVYNQLKSIEEIKLVEISSLNNNIWCRDYMPVKSANGQYIQFTYQPAYMRGMAKYKGNFPEVSGFLETQKIETTPSKIILDGGAIEICGKKGIVSDWVFRDNPGRTVSSVYNELKDILALDQLVVVPQYPYDFTGHVDGLVRFVSETQVVVNDLKKELRKSETDQNHYRKKLMQNWIFAFQSALATAGFEVTELPDSVPENGSPNSGEGIYTNFLLLEDLILMPVYGNDTDKTAELMLAELYGRTVIPINAKELSQMGGMINCVTWTK